MENVKRGKLKLKNGGKLKVASKHKKHKKKTSKRREDVEEKRHEQEKIQDLEADTDDMTTAQRRHVQHQKKREQEEIEKLASKTYRERIEELNQHLGSLTEHHDVPRVSAAGNG
ncbi:hypothetical protein PHYPSEUDO_005212 [Phytophthora pseudosyringae]|uniref:Uncharacterized protein n=1 Tax=Phytophthora pseudosyringae TaxID=221518 RepID=A0A8T1WH17_9STRA|nr:hypothetical protein PHYPSEUDO_005212 [Phytophthora pseudosyringae]